MHIVWQQHGVWTQGLMIICTAAKYNCKVFCPVSSRIVFILLSIVQKYFAVEVLCPVLQQVLCDNLRFESGERWSSWATAIEYFAIRKYCVQYYKVLCPVLYCTTVLLCVWKRWSSGASRSAAATASYWSETSEAPRVIINSVGNTPPPWELHTLHPEI